MTLPASTSWFPNKATLLAKADRLASLPVVVQHILCEIEREHGTAQSVADAMGKDPPLTARVLRVANSVFYARGGKVNSLHQAVARLGIREVRGVVLNTSLVTVFGLEQDQLRDLYVQGLLAAFASDAIVPRAANLRQGKDNPHFVAALLHDIGLFVLNRLAPSAYAKCLSIVQRTNEPCIEVERTLLGYTHTEVGAAVLLKWQLAPNEIEACRWHHAPGQAPEGFRAASYVVHLADAWARGILRGKLIQANQLDCDVTTLKVLGIDEPGMQRLLTGSDALLKKAREFESMLAKDSAAA